MNCDEIEIKYKDLLDKARENMKAIKDFEHDINHMNDVVEYTKELMNLLSVDFDKEVCLISAYWHDVGRTECDEGHEKISAEILKQEMIISGYDNCLIEKCYKAIENHKWNMNPNTIEGLILKDADKLAFLGKNRWEVCLKNKQNLSEIISLLPILKSEILYFEESTKIFDRDIVNLLEVIYNLYLEK